MRTKTVAAGAFKQGCLALLDEVAEGNVELVVTKRGRPVARVVPMLGERDLEEGVLARLRSLTRILATESAIVAPSSRLVRWKQLPARSTTMRPS